MYITEPVLCLFYKFNDILFCRNQLCLSAHIRL